MGRDIMGCGHNRASVIAASNTNREDFGPCLDPATVVMHWEDGVGLYLPATLLTSLTTTKKRK